MSDEYEQYNYDQDKFTNTGSGKHRSKKEAAEHTNHSDPSGHTRKILNKYENTEKKTKTQGSSSSKS